MPLPAFSSNQRLLSHLWSMCLAFKDFYELEPGEVPKNKTNGITLPLLAAPVYLGLAETIVEVSRCPWACLGLCGCDPLLRVESGAPGRGGWGTVAYRCDQPGGWS